MLDGPRQGIGGGVVTSRCSEQGGGSIGCASGAQKTHTRGDDPVARVHLGVPVVLVRAHMAEIGV